MSEKRTITMSEMADDLGCLVVSLRQLVHRHRRGQKKSGIWFFNDEEKQFYASRIGQLGKPLKKKESKK